MTELVRYSGIEQPSVHKDINKMKNKFDKNYFINMCKLIANTNDGCAV